MAKYIKEIPMQMEIPEAFEPLFEPARYKAFHGGRGSAKSHSIAAALIQMGYQKKLRIGCFREIQKSIGTSVKQLLDDKIAAQGLNKFYTSSQYSIKGANGTEFMFAGLRTNTDNIKSTEGLDIVWVEEADKCSQSSLDILTPTVRKPGSELWFSWNRRNTSDPVDNLFLGGEPPPNSTIRQVNWRDNPWFPEVLKAEMHWLKRRDHDKWLHVWEGQPLVLSQARVFNNWTVDDIDDQIPRDCVKRLGADWGFSIDPTVLIECYVWKRTLYFRREAWKVGCEIDEIPSLFAGTDTRGRWKNTHFHEGIPGASRERIVADSARPDTISYLKNRGFNIKGAKKGAGSIEDGIEFMKSFDIVVHPDCKHIEDELSSYSYKIDPLTDEVIAELADTDNHTIDSCRYALEGVRRASRGRISICGGEVIPLNY